MERGVKTLVDLTGDWRDILRQGGVRSGMQVIVATGIYREVPHFFQAFSTQYP
jgi:hypothetical protein